MAETIAELLVKVGADITGMQQGFSDAETKLTNFGNTATAAGTNLVKLGAPLVALGGAVAVVAGDFEGSMNILNVAAGGSNTTLEDLRKTAIKAGADVNLVGVSASDVATAMTNFTKAGVPVNTMLGSMEGYLAGTAQMGGTLRAAIDLAAASELDLEEASRLVITTLATFGKGAGSASDAMDLMVRAADASVLSVNDIKEALINVGPTMSGFGVPLGEVVTALALLSTRGITGAEAGTALQSMMLNLMRTTPDVTKTLDALNVSLYDQDGALKPLPTIIGDLQRAMAGMTEEQRNATIITLAGTYGQKAMNTLLTEGAPGWDAMTTAIGSAATMQGTAEARTKGFNASMEQLRSSVETFMINAGTPLIENVLTPLVKKFTEIVAGLAEMDPKWVGIAITVGVVLVALGGLLLVAGQFAIAIAALGPVLAVIGAALGAISLPVVAIGVALAALVLAWNGNWFGIRDTLTAVWDEKLKPVFEAIKAWLEVNIPAAIAVVVGFWTNTLLPAIKDVWKFIDETLIPIFETIVTWLGTTIGAAIKTLSGFWNDTLLPAIKDVWKFIDTYLVPIFKAVADVMDAAVTLALKALQGLWENVFLPALKTVYNFINDNFLRIFGSIASTMSGGVTTALNDLTGLWNDHLLPALRAVYNFINDTLGGVFGTLANKLSGGVTTATNDLSGLWNNTLLPALKGVKTYIADNLQPGFDTLAGNFSTGIGASLTTLTGLWNDHLLPALQDIWGFIKYSVLGVFSDLTTSVGTTLSGPLTIIKDLWASLKLSIEKIPQILTDISTWFGTLATKISEVKLPSWLTPGSATPFETALLGILDALKLVSGGPWGWFLDFVDFVTGGNRGGGGGGPVTNINVSLAPGSVVVYNTDPSGANDVGLAIARALKALIDAEGTVGARAAGQWTPPWAA